MIKLTKTEGSEVWVNPNAIGYIRPRDHHPGTDMFNLTGSHILTVIESCSDIADRVRATRSVS